MKRKLVQMNKHTLMATVPKTWIRKHGLTKEDSVDFIEFEDKLILSPLQKSFKKKTTISIKQPVIEVVWRVLQPTYIAGFDEVRVEFTDKKVIQILEECLHMVVGFDIVERGNNYCVIQTIAQVEDNIDSLIKRSWHILIEISDLTRHNVKKKNLENLSIIKTMELSMNKYIMLLKRIINKTGHKYSYALYSIVTFLELTSNQFEYFRRLIHKNNGFPEHIILKDFYSIYDLIKKVHKLYYTFSSELFEEISTLQPHFNWFNEGLYYQTYLKKASEYLVQIARQVYFLNITDVNKLA